MIESTFILRSKFNCNLHLQERLVLLSGALRKVTKLTYSDIDFLAVKVFRVASCRSGVKLEEATDR